MPDAAVRLGRFLSSCQKRVERASPLAVHGRLTRVAGLVMEAVGLKLAVGSTCLIYQNDVLAAEAEVVGFNGERVFLMPSTEVHGLTAGALVMPLEVARHAPVYAGEGEPFPNDADMPEERTKHLPVGEALLGRVVDGAGRPLDRLGPIHSAHRAPLAARSINPIERQPIERPLDVGVRAINAMLTVGRGQRMGLFAGSGVGKSVLLGMMARFTEADVTVVGLIGERGREVKEFIDHILGTEGLARSVVVAAPADAAPLMRLQGAAYATVLAEHFRDEGKNVLLIMDSLTRYAMAQREIALAIGEPPATKGYPPSVFAKLPALVERAGNGTHGKGSITAFYTVLTEGDDQQDPIADSARAILDGHIVLDRALADTGHYPAIDIEQSISRAMHNIVDARQQQGARTIKKLFSRYQRSRDLIQVGAYIPGSDPELDRAIAAHGTISQFLQQGIQAQAPYPESCAELALIADQFGGQT
jgi:flagellum-specific ATP synthase